jgi:uncharacterized protein YoxC
VVLHETCKTVWLSLEALLGVPVEGSSSSLAEQLAEAQRAITDLQTSLDKLSAEASDKLRWEKQIEEQVDLTSHQVDGLAESLGSLGDDFKGFLPAQRQNWWSLKEPSVACLLGEMHL